MEDSIKAGLLSGSSWRILAPAGAGRLALIAVVVPVWGARMALIALLAWGIAATGYAMTSRLGADPSDRMVTRCCDDGEMARWLGRLVRAGPSRRTGQNPAPSWAGRAGCWSPGSAR